MCPRHSLRLILGGKVQSCVIWQLHHAPLLSKFRPGTYRLCCLNSICEITDTVSGSIVSDSLRPHGPQPTRLLCPWDSPGKNTGVGCHSLLQSIFPTQGSNPGLPHYRQALFRLSHQGSPQNKGRESIYF